MLDYRRGRLRLVVVLLVVGTLVSATVIAVHCKDVVTLLVLILIIACPTFLPLLNACRPRQLIIMI